MYQSLTDVLNKQTLFSSDLLRRTKVRRDTLPPGGLGQYCSYYSEFSLVEQYFYTGASNTVYMSSHTFQWNEYNLLHLANFIFTHIHII